MSDNGRDRKNRSVADFNSPIDLLRGMQSMSVQESSGNEEYVSFSNPAQQMSTKRNAAFGDSLNDRTIGSEPLDPKFDWVLENCDEETSDPQTLGEELKRLLVLKSYLLLDTEQQESFERIAAIASRLFRCPMALISLVDLGRQWFLSNRGLGDVRETDRKSAFCAHAIWGRQAVFIVPDATKDPRFSKNPFVIGPPDVRFYAGVPLLSPEGYKLGTLCILDRVARPDGLNAAEKQNLQDLASMAVQAAVDHKSLNLQDSDDPTQLIACTAHDLMTPLTGVQISLSLLNEDKSFRSKTNKGQRELIFAASECTDIMGRICQTAISSFRKNQQNAGGKLKKDLPNLLVRISSNSLTEMKVSSFVKKLHAVLTSFPKSVPLNIAVHEAVPDTIVTDDTKVFRAAINYLTNACSRTKEGAVNLSITVVLEKNKRMIRFECEDSGSDIPAESYSSLFRPFKFDVKGDKESESYATLLETDISQGKVPNSALGLYSVALHISSLGGDYGFRPRVSSTNSWSEQVGTEQTGSIFWFQIRLVVPNGQSKGKPPFGDASQSKLAVKNEPDEISMSQNAKRSNKIVPRAPLDRSNTTKVKVNGARDANARKRKALVIEDSMVVRKSLTRVLTKLAFEVTQAVDGMEGLRELQSSIFDVVLCDFLMPVMDGLDCVQQYREWENTRRPFFKQYIIGISAHASSTDVEKGKEVGMDDFKPKPVTFKQLVELSSSETLAAYSNELDSFGRKRMKMLNAHLDSSERDEDPKHKQAHVCLIAMARKTTEVELIKTVCENRNWKLVVVNNGEEAFRLMKLRTWDAILIDEDLPLLPSSQCISRFREWEAVNRIMKQRNVALVSSSCASVVHTLNSMMQLPFGVDFALGKPIRVQEFEFIMNQAEENSMGCGARDIVAR